jgi:hypothetical protein
MLKNTVPAVVAALDQVLRLIGQEVAAKPGHRDLAKVV